MDRTQTYADDRANIQQHLAGETGAWTLSYGDRLLGDGLHDAHHDCAYFGYFYFHDYLCRQGVQLYAACSYFADSNQPDAVCDYLLRICRLIHLYAEYQSEVFCGFGTWHLGRCCDAVLAIVLYSRANVALQL